MDINAESITFPREMCYICSIGYGEILIVDYTIRSESTLKKKRKGERSEREESYLVSIDQR